MKKYFASLIACIIPVISFALDSSTVQITFKGQPNLIESMSIESAPMACAGESNAYAYNGYSTDLKHKTIELNITGTFYKDYRNACHINDNGVYFIMKNILVNYTFNGRQLQCIIAENVGTTHSDMNGGYDNLVGESNGQTFSCGGTNQGHTFTVHPAKFYGIVFTPGYIEINVQ